MNNIYWLGGSPCSGKSTCAEILQKKFGLHYYKCDDHFAHHLEEGAKRAFPMSSIVKQVTHEYIFMRSDADNLRLPLELYAEHFSLILEDIASLRRPLIIEGCALLPDLLARQKVAKQNVFYMTPKETFFRAEYKKRTWAHERLKETSDPAQAFENWMSRDVAFAREIAGRARLAGFACLEVDGSKSIAETVKQVANHFGLKETSETLNESA